MNRSSVVKIRNWINSLGLPFSSLVAQGIIADEPLSELYENSATLDMEPILGIELSFSEGAQIFQAIYITTRSNDPTNNRVYTGKLPAPFENSFTKDKVRSVFGNPLRSYGLMHFTDPVTKTVGGWDFYVLDEFQNPGVQVEFQYDEALNLEKLMFTITCDAD